MIQSIVCEDGRITKNRVKQFSAVLTMICLFLSGCAHKEVAVTEPPGQATQETGGAEPDSITYSVRQARDQVLDYFYPLKGVIEARDDDVVRVKLREEGTIKQGMRLSVFREGDPFYHPVTNELIGRSENSVGRIELKDEHPVDGLYVFRIINGDLSSGDRARISASRIKLAFFQDRKANWMVSEAFYDSLKDSGRFEIIDAYTPDYQSGTLARRAREAGAEAALMFSTRVKDDRRVLNVKLYWAEEGALFGEIEETAQNVAEIAPPDEEFISRSFKNRELWKRFRLPGGQLTAMGDVDGNGIDEFVVSDQRTIRIYSVKDELRELWSVKTGGEGVHLSLDTFDVNGNGRAEIFVTSIVNAGKISTNENELYKDDMRADSFVIEYDPSGNYRKVADNMPYFLRVSGKMLLMQAFNRNRIFSGPVYKGVFRDMKYQPAEPLELPDTANIYGFVFIDWGDKGLRDVITYDNDGYLYLYDQNGHVKWRSDSSLGPFAYTFESRTDSLVNPTLNWSVRSRLALVRTERGREVVALSRKPVLAGVPGLGASKTSVYTFWWDGAVMDQQVLLEDIPGAITDYWIQGRELFLLAKGDIFTFLGSLAEGEFSKSSILYYYNFSPLESPGNTAD